MNSITNVFLDEGDHIRVGAHPDRSSGAQWQVYLSFQEREFSTPNNLHMSWEQAEDLARKIMAEVDGHRHDEEVGESEDLTAG